MDSILSTSLGGGQKVLLLGAGFVTRPTAQILSDAGIQVTVGRDINTPRSCHDNQLTATDSMQNSRVSEEAFRRSPELLPHLP